MKALDGAHFGVRKKEPFLALRVKRGTLIFGAARPDGVAAFVVPTERSARIPW